SIVVLSLWQFAVRHSCFAALKQAGTWTIGRSLCPGSSRVLAMTLRCRHPKAHSTPVGFTSGSQIHLPSSAQTAFLLRHARSTAAATIGGPENEHSATQAPALPGQPYRRPATSSICFS